MSAARDDAGVGAVAEADAVRLHGPLDAASARAMLAAVMAATAGRPAPAALDLGDVTRVDSTGLALLVGWRRDFGDGLEIRRVPPSARALADLSGIDKWLLGEDSA